MCHKLIIWLTYFSDAEISDIFNSGNDLDQQWVLTVTAQLDFNWSFVWGLCCCVPSLTVNKKSKTYQIGKLYFSVEHWCCCTEHSFIIKGILNKNHLVTNKQKYFRLSNKSFISVV